MSMKKDLAAVPDIARHLDKRGDAAGTENMRGSHRIDLEHVEHLSFRGIAKEGGNFTVTIDEPVDAGGHGAGPRPTSYFLLGAGSCLLMQWAKLAMIKNLNLDNLRAIVRGHTNGAIDGYFTEFIFDISVDSLESEEKIKQVAQESERFCFVHNTLKRGVRCITNVSLNGRSIYSNTAGPNSSTSASTMR